jgi:hypothetical protein
LVLASPRVRARISWSNSVALGPAPRYEPRRLGACAPLQGGQLVPGMGGHGNKKRPHMYIFYMVDECHKKLYGEGEQDPRADSHRGHVERNNELKRCIRNYTHHFFFLLSREHQ